MPEMRSVFSSHVNQIGYDEDAGELHVVFANGSHVVYSGVDAKAGRDVLSAPSIGAELHRGIRGRHRFDYRVKAKPERERNG